jgi:3-hydroxyisobutyrate dehydrogenase-like beta-hydroxyacid dehydrogenase
MQVAFAGLGNLGSGIAQCILKAGFDLAVWNRTFSKTSALVDRGARAAATAREAVAEAEVVVSCLMDDQSVIDAVQSPSGILAGMKPAAVHMCVTTISPRCAEQLEAIHARHGSSYVSAPVLGRPDAALSGQLASFLGGPAGAVERVTPVCNAYSSQVTRVSERPAAANCMKLALNYNIVSIIELIGESYVFAEKCGLPLEPLRDFYQQLAFAHPALRMYAEKLRARDFAGRGGFVMKGGLKDVRLMLQTAADHGAALEIGKIIEPKLKAAVDAGMQEQDWSAFYEITRRNAGLT